MSTLRVILNCDIFFSRKRCEPNIHVIIHNTIYVCVHETLVRFKLRKPLTGKLGGIIAFKFTTVIFKLEIAAQKSVLCFKANYSVRYPNLTVRFSSLVEIALTN